MGQFDSLDESSFNPQKYPHWEVKWTHFWVSESIWLFQIWKLFKTMRRFTPELDNHLTKPESPERWCPPVPHPAHSPRVGGAGAGRSPQGVSWGPGPNVGAGRETRAKSRPCDGMLFCGQEMVTFIRWLWFVLLRVWIFNLWNKILNALDSIN